MRVVPTCSVLALSAYGNDMDVEHNACRLPARCGEPSLYCFVSGFVHANRQSNTRNQRVWDWVRVDMVILAKFDNQQ
jgi:hypothetical protein